MFEKKPEPEPRKAHSYYLPISLMEKIREEAERAGMPTSVAVQTVIEAGVAALEQQKTETETENNN